LARRVDLEKYIFAIGPATQIDTAVVEVHCPYQRTQTIRHNFGQVMPAPGRRQIKSPVDVGLWSVRGDLGREYAVANNGGTDVQPALDVFLHDHR
jgi:hypothetical protein